MWVALFFGGSDVPLHSFCGALNGAIVCVVDGDFVGRE